MDAGGSDTDTLAPAARLLLRTLGHRLELIALELAEARSHLLGTGIAIGIATLACVLAGVGATLLVAALFWDSTHRVSALLVLALLYAAGAAIAVWRLRRAWKAWEPFDVTHTALQDDLRWLRRQFGEDEND